MEVELMWRPMYVAARTAYETLSQAQVAPRVARVPLYCFMPRAARHYECVRWRTETSRMLSYGSAALLLRRVEMSFGKSPERKNEPHY
jgi:hypothetical protein